jgi:hypothetical protein
MDLQSQNQTVEVPTNNKPVQLESLLVLDVSDEKYSIGTKKKPGLVPGSDEAKQIWNRFIQEYDIFSRFWAPRYQVAKKCMRYRRRDIFTRQQRDEYINVYGKIPVEPQEMKQVIDVIAGQIGLAVRGGAIEYEDLNPPPNAASPQVVNVVIKALESRLKLERKKKGALREALYGGIPNWIWFDRERTAEGNPGRLRATLLPWDSTLCSFLFLEEDGADIDHVKVVGHRTKDEMFDAFPNRKECFLDHLNLLNTQPDYLNNVLGFDQTLNSEDRKNMLYDRITTGRYDAIQGFLFVIESTFVIHKKVEVQINEKTGDVVMLPPEWEDWEVQRWHAMYPDYNLTKEQIHKVLWQTTIDNSGFVWENSEHWYQDNGELPGACYIPAFEDKIPSGMGEDLIPYVLAIAVAETEGLAQVRTGAGDVLHVVEGSLLHPGRLTKESSSERGTVLYKKSAALELGGIDKLYKREVRQPNEAYLKFADRMRAQKREIRNVNPSMMGQSDPRQSVKSKIQDITSAMAINSQFIDNYCDFNLKITELLARMLPYSMTEHEIIAINDEFGKNIGPVEVNKPQFGEGPNPAMVAVNDLTSARYRVVPTPSDDSPTNREREMQEFKDMISSVGNTLLQIDPDIIAAIWKDWPNRYCREAAAGLEELAQKKQAAGMQKEQTEKQLEMAKTVGQQQMDFEKIKRPRWNIRLQPTDYQEAPEGFRLMMEALGKINATPPQPAQGAPGPMPQGQPGAQPQPAMAGR